MADPTIWAVIAPNGAFVTCATEREKAEDFAKQCGANFRVRGYVPMDHHTSLAKIQAIEAILKGKKSDE